jgi:AcrR family transcriptional regulator
VKDEPDRRSAQTRTAILAAFAKLALDRRYGTIRIADLIAEAEIGRSTFYEHFRGKDEVLLSASDHILAGLANAATRRAGLFATRMALQHLWNQRGVVRAMLSDRVASKLQRRLATMIEDRMERGGLATGTMPQAMLATAIAAGQLAVLKMWVTGEAPATLDELARLMNEFSPFHPRSN